MDADKKTSLVLIGTSAAFVLLGAGFVLDLWGQPRRAPEIPLVDDRFIDPSPVRVSAAELIRTEGDTSGFDCYACHDRGVKIELKLDSLGEVIPPADHDDLVFQHGRHGRNNFCFNCHDPENLDRLHTREGQRFTLEKSNLLCASCHGPTYRDWEAGIHGRTSGFWDRSRGGITRLDCTSCHDPHAPAFPKIEPAPGPHPLHLKDRLILEALKETR